MKPAQDLRSARWFAKDDFRSFGHRSRVLQMGCGAEDFIGKPVIAIINTWSDANQCHTHFKQRVEARYSDFAYVAFGVGPGLRQWPIAAALGSHRGRTQHGDEQGEGNPHRRSNAGGVESVAGAVPARSCPAGQAPRRSRRRRGDRKTQ